MDSARGGDPYAPALVKPAQLRPQPLQHHRPLITIEDVVAFKRNHPTARPGHVDAALPQRTDVKPARAMN
jgi:hypothetical protein